MMIYRRTVNHIVVQLHFVENKKRPKRVQISRVICIPDDRREIRPHGHSSLACWIINFLLGVLLCSIADYYMASSASGQDDPNRAM